MTYLVIPKSLASVLFASEFLSAGRGKITCLLEYGSSFLYPQRTAINLDLTLNKCCVFHTASNAFEVRASELERGANANYGEKDNFFKNNEVNDNAANAGAKVQTAHHDRAIEARS